MFTKRQTVLYTPYGTAQASRARVDTVHRDGTFTVVALFYQRKGEDVPGYLGCKYRMGPETMHARA